MGSNERRVRGYDVKGAPTKAKGRGDIRGPCQFSAASGRDYSRLPNRLSSIMNMLMKSR
jgi:hypothetical protein